MPLSRQNTTNQSRFPDGLVVYQIYPRSFKDSNNDGIGDLKGIISKLDYLADLGVNAIWLCPVYSSPMIDGGYDVSDYENVDPTFGSLKDLDTLIAQAARRNIQVLLDIVANHTSDKHAWFIESRSSLDNPKRNWYVWKDPTDSSSEPNNWLSVFGGPAWEYDPHTKQYYLHSFAKQQPDLNWQNPEVRQAMKNAMRFWLDRGIAGFRMDAVDWYAKDASLRDDLPNPAYNPSIDSPYNMLLHRHSKGQKEIYKYLQELSDVLLAYPDRYMLIEAHFDTLPGPQQFVDFYRKIDTRVAAPFNFSNLYLPWEAKRFETCINTFQSRLRPQDTPVYVSGSHDRTRLATRFGMGATRAAAMLFLTLPGIAVIYNGEEIGMENVQINTTSTQDIIERSITGRGQGRDGERTPMQWSSSRNAGFSDHTPWLPISSNYLTTNVQTEESQPDSLLNLYRQLINLRHTSPAIKIGTYQPLPTNHADLFAYLRIGGQQKLTVIINFSRSKSAPCPIVGEMLLSTHSSQVNTPLQPLEGRILQIP